jgi:hypothetical protein
MAAGGDVVLSAGSAVAVRAISDWIAGFGSTADLGATGLKLLVRCSVLDDLVFRVSGLAA